MEYFNKYVSNTTGGSGNQTFFCVNGAEVHRGRVYYKIYAGGCFSYSLMFSNVLDSTFADGSETRCNMSGDEWKIQKVSVGICRECDGEMVSVPTEMKVLTFQKKESRIVRPGDIFFSDEFELEAEKDEYLCVEIAFSGIDNQIKESVKIPCHEESILPAFILEE